MGEQLEDWMQPGARVIWRYSTPRRTEQPIPMPAIIVSVSLKRVRVKLFLGVGDEVERTALPRDISPRDWPSPIDKA